MGIKEKMWDAITTVIRMNDKVERLANTVVSQQTKIEGLTERVVRLEAKLKIALTTRAPLTEPKELRIDADASADG